MQAFELTFEEIDDALGGGWAGTLWGCAFEDFLTRRFGPERREPGRGLPAAPRLEGARRDAHLHDRLAGLGHELARGERHRAGPVLPRPRPDPRRRAGARHGADRDADPEALGPDRRQDRGRRRSAGHWPAACSPSRWRARTGCSPPCVSGPLPGRMAGASARPTASSAAGPAPTRTCARRHPCSAAPGCSTCCRGRWTARHRSLQQRRR